MGVLHRSLFIAILVAIVWAIPLTAQQRVSIAELLKNEDRYDGKVVTVVGMITRYKEPSGERFTYFLLEESGSRIYVMAERSLGLRNGLRVRVTGEFFSGSSTFSTTTIDLSNYEIETPY